ncbi:hypothetical protein GCM10022224_100460 [Nonomuraea antimicrobica]|uniref:Lipoprotein n=1 Tax=Nonomuraea antimicrobica TaxID=561173 RepID=A0ABP7EFT0_9ACTN
MKRILAGLALASSAALMTAAPAQAAPVDPVKALKKQYVTGHGVRVSESAKTVVDGKSSATMTTNGAFGFGGSRVVAADLRTEAKGGTGLEPSRLITVGKHSYAQGGLFSVDLPEGKKWVRYPYDGGPLLTSQPLNVLDPKVLKTLVSKAKSFKGGTYQGAISFGDLSKFYGEKISGKIAKVKINYSLDVNSKGLVDRIRSQYTMDFGVLGSTTATVNTRFTGWGAKTTVKAPPADAVVDISEFGADTQVPQEIPNGSLNSLGGTQ